MNHLPTSFCQRSFRMIPKCKKQFCYISVTINCGGSSSENITTFQSPGGSSLAGACNAEICKISSDVGQLRLDFTTFTISDPEAHVAASLTHVNLNGAASFIGGAAYTSAGQCSVDTFSVTSPGSSGTPVICGTNTGEHSKLHKHLEWSKTVFLCSL